MEQDDCLQIGSLIVPLGRFSSLADFTQVIWNLEKAQFLIITFKDLDVMVSGA